MEQLSVVGDAQEGHICFSKQLYTRYINVELPLPLCTVKANESCLTFECVKGEFGFYAPISDFISLFLELFSHLIFIPTISGDSEVLVFLGSSYSAVAMCGGRRLSSFDDQLPMAVLTASWLMLLIADL